MRHSKIVQLAAFAVGIAVILACGGGGTAAGDHFPLTSSVRITSINDDTDNIHIFMTGEDFNISNRVNAISSTERNGTHSYTWNDAQSVVTVTVYAGRNGVVFDSTQVQITGDQRMQGKAIVAHWSIGQTLTASLQ